MGLYEPLTLVLTIRITIQVCLDPEMTSNRPMAGWLPGWICVRVCVRFKFGFQSWSPCKGIISPSPPDINIQHTVAVPKKWRRFTSPIAALTSAIYMVWIQTNANRLITHDTLTLEVRCHNKKSSWMYYDQVLLNRFSPENSAVLR